MGAEYYREYRKTHPPKPYTEKQKEAARVRSREWRKEHPGYSAEYFATRPGKRAEYRRRYKEKERAYGKEWAAENVEHIRQYQKAHSAERAAREGVRRAAKVGTTVTQLAEIGEIYRRAKEDKMIRCYLCGGLIAIGERHVDHIMPLSKGGQHRPSNLAIACAKCNLSKGGKLPHEVGVLL